jgi:hypothetical protein
VLLIVTLVLGASVYALTYRPWFLKQTTSPSEQMRSIPGLARSPEGLGRNVSTSPSPGLSSRQHPEAKNSSGSEAKTSSELEAEASSRLEPPVPGAVARADMASRPEPQAKRSSLLSGAGSIALRPQIISEIPPYARRGQTEVWEIPAAPKGQRTLLPEAGVMARFNAAPAEPEPQEPEEILPELPDRFEITRVMDSIKRLIQRCYDNTMVPGRVDLSLIVEGQNGRVVKTTVSETSSTAICIRRLARTLQFPRFSRSQMIITHPYTFR